MSSFLPLSLTSLLLPFLVLLSAAPSGVVSQLSHERSILVKLKQQLENPPSLRSWTNSSSPCEWPEIRCSGETVTQVILQNINITVPIPETVCDLTNLTHLDLSYNYIPGRFPKVLYSCSQLQYLDLSQNYFVGPIPDDIDRLSANLRYMDLGANNFSGDIPKSIGRLSGLKTLHLYQNEFNGTFPEEIGNLKELEVLGLAYNQKFVPASIPLRFGRLKKLKFLWMKDANLIGAIPEDLFRDLSVVEHIDFAMNRLVGRIPSGLFGLKNLKNLYLFGNRLSGEIPKTVLALNLEEIDLSMNNLTGSIPSDYGKLTKLKVLNLFSNELTGEVPASLGSIRTLTTISVFRNKLSGELPQDLGLNSKLEALEVSENRFTGKLPENLCRGRVLQGVVAFSNDLSGEIPESLGNCPSLRTLQLYNNRFSGEVPEGIWTTFNLSSLMLSNNFFTGKLPEKLAWNLSRVEIKNNRFAGEIPSGVSSWSRLEVLEASDNRFWGKMPRELTSLSRLSALYLAGNQLSGELPSDIVSWRSLTTLDLSRNRLSGEIPAAMGSLPRLINLDLSENRFLGEIPPEIGNLRFTSLNLSSNRFSGKIPEELDNLAYRNSFLNNSDLCAEDPILGFPDCRVKLHRSSKTLPSKVLPVVLVLVVLVFVMAVLSTFFLVRDYTRKRRSQDLETWKLTSFHRLGFTEANILSSLTESNLIGSGGSGKVYKIPVNPSRDCVAVKKVWNSRKLDASLEKEFVAEVEILGTIRHANIVKLLCCISSEDSKLLVYEYMENRSLDRWLHKDRGASPSSYIHHAVLDWPRRLQIAVGAAQGLCYMHHDCSPAIIHRDVKSSNILLDSKFNARIADFGLAKILKEHAEANTMSAVAGSFGYIAPEYAYTSKANEKVDVYSFGVVLLELVTGKEANFGDEHTNLAEWAWRQYQEERPIWEVLDKEVKGQRYLEEMSTVFKLGLACTTRLPATRPSMKEVLHVLRRCSSEEGHGEGKVGKVFDSAPLLDCNRQKSHRGGEDGEACFDCNV